MQPNSSKVLWHSIRDPNAVCGWQKVPHIWTALTNLPSFCFPFHPLNLAYVSSPRATHVPVPPAHGPSHVAMRHVTHLV